MWRTLQGRGSQSAALFKDVEWRNAAPWAKQFRRNSSIARGCYLSCPNPSTEMSPWIRRRAIFHRAKITRRSRLYEFRFRAQRFAIYTRYIVIHLIYASQIFWHLRKAFDFYRHRTATRCTSLYKKTDVENLSANIVINVSHWSYSVHNRQVVQKSH